MKTLPQIVAWIIILSVIEYYDVKTKHAEWKKINCEKRIIRKFNDKRNR